MKSKNLFLIFTIFAFGLVFLPAVRAQDAPELRLSLRRDFGFSASGRIQGTFSFRAEGPDNLEQVTFFIDGEEVGTDTEAPFRLQFRTENYPVGAHTLSAVGITSNAQELRSNRLQRQFVSSSESNRLLFWVVIPIVVLAVGGRALTAWLANRGRKEAGKPVVSGPLGGTICPNCEKPYAIHVWSFNLAAFRIDRCPHCGAWRRVRRMAQSALEAAADNMETAAGEGTAGTPPESDADALRRRLDDSRFDDNP